jgi:hypothetical protein
MVVLFHTSPLELPLLLTAFPAKLKSTEVAVELEAGAVQLKVQEALPLVKIFGAV